VSQNILFSEAKKELFSPSSGYRSLQVDLYESLHMMICGPIRFVPVLCFVVKYFNYALHSFTHTQLKELVFRDNAACLHDAGSSKSSLVSWCDSG
jgi:hypothetical protein